MRFIIMDTPKEIGETIAKDFESLLKEKPNAIFGLATGSTPLPLYAALIEAYKAGKLSFKEAKSFNLDEYVNAPKEADTYRYFMKTNLFEHVDFKEGANHFPSFENMKTYDQSIDEAGGIDLQILGIGRDGHVGFNEPDTPFDSLTHLAELTENTREANARFFKGGEETPHEAITMGLKTIYKARRIVLIASDLTKVDAIRSLKKGVEDLAWPCTSLLSHPNVDIYLTKELFAAI